MDIIRPMSHAPKSCEHGRIPAMAEGPTPQTAPCPSRPGGHHAYVYDAAGDGHCECGATDPICFYDQCNDGGSG